MDYCEICSSQAFFICNCSNAYLCKTDLGKHLAIRANHQYKKLFKELDPTQKSILVEKLQTWITTLINLKKQVNLQTKGILKKIESCSNSLIKKINTQTRNYLDLISKSSFKSSQKKEIKQIIDSEMETSQFSLNDLQLQVIEKYSHHLYSFISDPANDMQSKYKEFLKTHNGGFLCVAISTDAKTLVTGSEDTSVRVWNMETQTQLACLLHHKSDVKCLAIFKDGTFAVSGSFDKTLILWDIRNMGCKNVYRGHSGAVLTAGFSEDCSLIVSGSSTKEIFIWKTQSAECLNRIITSGIVRCGFISAKNLFYAGIGIHLKVIDLITYQNIFSIYAHYPYINSIAITKTEEFLITCSDDKLVKIWKSNTKSLFATLSGHTQGVSSVSVTSDDKFIVSGSEDETIILWSIELKTKLHQFEFHKDNVYGVTTAEDLIISASRDSRIGVTRISSKNFECFLNLKKFLLRSEMIKEKLVAYGSGNDVAICNVNQNEKILKGHSGLVQTVCISSKMNLLVTGSMGIHDNLIIWDLRKFSMISQLEGHLDSVFCADILNDERKAISGDYNAKVILWDLENLRKEFIFEGHSEAVYSVKFTNGGRFACSGGNDKRIFVWSIQNKEVHACFNGHVEAVWKVLITKDDKFVVSCGDFDGVRVWSISEKRQEFAFRNKNEAQEWLDRYRELEFYLTRFLF